MKRIWNVRLNVDEFNSGIAGMDDDADRVRFLSGLHAGLNGKPTMPKGVAWEAGWVVGNSSHLEALKFGDQQRARALKRDYGYAPAMPRHSHGEATAMPIYNLQSTIEVSNNRTIEQSKEKRFAPPSLDEVRAYCHERKNQIDPQEFIDKNESTGWMRGKNKIKSWEAVIRTWEANDRKWHPAAPPKQQAPTLNLDI